jgi:hypothetical protein
MADMEYNLFEFVSSLSDPRRGQGQRHTLQNVLTIVVMAILSGHQGLRGFTRFATSNSEELTEVLQLKHGIPCYYTFWSIFNSLDEQLLAQKFITWMRQYHLTLDDDFISIDGKAVKSTVNGGNTELQNFVSVVSAFGHQSGLVYGMRSSENGKGGEVPALRELVKDLGLSGKVFTVDAAHTKKNI